MKFGGSSVADADCLRRVAALVGEALPATPLVVLSAMGKTTDALFSAAEAARLGRLRRSLALVRAMMGRHRRAAEALFGATLPSEVELALMTASSELRLLLRGVALLRELSPRSLDAITGQGERMSSALLAGLLRSQGVAATLVDARTVMRTDDGFGAAQPQREAIRALAAETLLPLLGPDRAVVTQGYIGATGEGLTTTLGRGGSDYSAALLGAALDADEVQIWTDVEGVLTCDPRVVPQALPIAHLSFAEAAELAAFGAKVLHPATIQPAVEANIPVTVRDSRHPAGRFTTITAKAHNDHAVTALATRAGITVLTVSSTRMLNQSGFLARLFDVFGRHRVSVDLVATAEVSVSLTVDTGVALKTLLEELSGFARVEVSEGRAIVAMVGERLKHTPRLGARAFAALGEINVEMISMGANEINLSLVVRSEDAAEALRRLHAALIEGGPA